MQTGCVSNSENGGHHAADQLVTTHVWLVRAIAKQVLEKLPSHVELNDLIEDGVSGLIAAAQRYDPARGIPFPLYAEHRIRGAILDGLRRMDHLSRDSRSKVKKADASTLEDEAGRDPAPAVWRASTAGHTWMGMWPEQNGTAIAPARAGCSSAKPCEPVADAGSRPEGGRHRNQAGAKGGPRRLAGRPAPPPAPKESSDAARGVSGWHIQSGPPGRPA